MRSVPLSNIEMYLDLEVEMPGLRGSSLIGGLEEARRSTLRKNTKAFGDGPCSFEPRLSDENDIRAGTPFSAPPRHIKVETLSHDRLNVHQPLKVSGLQWPLTGTCNVIRQRQLQDRQQDH
ncbi:hypothetical protein TNCV_1913611 [Trichonephila clavipes]|nr:hypothetical protein TNCV_1913611 [Trichonephila clavipes]